MQGRRASRLASDSTAAQQARRRALDIQVEPPVGAGLRSNEAKRLWVAFTSSRLPTDWTTADLEILVDLVNVSLEIGCLEKLLKAEGTYFVNDKGEMKPHPRVAERDKARNYKLSLLRLLGMNSSMVAARSKTGTGAPAVDHQEKGKKKGTLLAVA